MIPNVTRLKLEQTMEKFDFLERRLPEWKDWEQQPGHEFVIFREKKKFFYPVKHIIEVATGLKESQIDDLEALNYIAGRGFRVVSVARYLEQVASEQEKQLKNKPTKLPPKVVPDSQLFNPELLRIRIERFKDSHGSFTSDFYLSDERNYKLEASQLFHDSLGEERLKELIDASEFDKASGIVRSIYQKDNLLYKPWEVLPLLNIPNEALVRSLYSLLYGNEVFRLGLKPG